jgi:hypothetical protein
MNQAIESISQHVYSIVGTNNYTYMYVSHNLALYSGLPLKTLAELL